MKFNVPSKTLYGYVAAVSKVINSKNAMAILNHFLFTLKGNTLTITASDIENTLTATLEVSEPEGEGCFCLDAHRIVDLLKELPDLGITMEVDDNTLATCITYPGGKFDFVGVNGNEYPRQAVESDENRITFDCPTSQIISGIDNTVFAVGTNTVRPQMMGILWDIKPESITFVATDTRKLVRYTNTQSQPGSTASCILPVKPSTVLKNVFGKEENIHVELTPKSATFTAGAFTFNCSFIKGQFPDYNRVIPTNNPYSLTIDRVAFLNAIRRVAVFVDPGHGLVKFKITPDKIIMKAQDNNFCTSAVETLPCDFSGNEMIIGFAAPYLLEIFNTLTTSEIVIKLSDPSRPGVFLPSEEKPDSDLLMLLMPMTVNEF